MNREKVMTPRPARLWWSAAAAALACGLVSAPGAAATYYVDGSSASCSVIGPGTLANPYCTISAALSAQHAPGTTIHVQPGTYREQVTLPASGTQSSPIVIEADGAGPVVLDGADDYSSPAAWDLYQGSVYVVSAVTWLPKRVFVDNDTLAVWGGSAASTPVQAFRADLTGLYVNLGGDNPGSHQTLVTHRKSGFTVSGQSWVTIQGFQVTRFENRGVLLDTASNVTVSGNTVVRNVDFGMQVIGCSATTVQSNTVSDNFNHGVSVSGGTTASTIASNECARNARPGQRAANGIYLEGSSGNTVKRNRVHHNQDTGLHLGVGSSNNLLVQNLSWSNGDHGFDHLGATGNVHIGEVAWGNWVDGFSNEGDAPGQSYYDCISINNGLSGNGHDLYVDSTSASGFQSNDNVFWSPNGAAPVRFYGVTYATVSAYSAASGQDTRTVQSDPLFVDPAGGDFHLQVGSPAIDNANTGITGWPGSDADGRAPLDDPGTPNTGVGPIAYADRGALEYVPAVAVSDPPPAIAERVTPNPVRGQGLLVFSTTRPGPLRVDLYDVQGRWVRGLADEEQAAAGPHAARLDGAEAAGAALAPGIYFYRIRSVDGASSGRFVLVR